MAGKPSSRPLGVELSRGFPTLDFPTQCVVHVANAPALFMTCAHRYNCSHAGASIDADAVAVRFCMLQACVCAPVTRNSACMPHAGVHLFTSTRFDLARATMMQNNNELSIPARHGNNAGAPHVVR